MSRYKTKCKYTSNFVDELNNNNKSEITIDLDDNLSQEYTTELKNIYLNN